MAPSFCELERLRIGSFIRLYRIRKCFSIHELASLVDITSNNLIRIESGKSSVCLDVLSRICQALDCAVLVLPIDLIHELSR